MEGLQGLTGCSPFSSRLVPTYHSALASVQATIGTQPASAQQGNEGDDVEMGSGEDTQGQASALPKEVEDVLAETNAA